MWFDVLTLASGIEHNSTIFKSVLAENTMMREGEG